MSAWAIVGIGFMVAFVASLGWCWLRISGIISQDEDLEELRKKLCSTSK